MAFKLPERVQETTTTTGTGTLDLLGAVSGAYAFSSQLSNNDTTYYVISDSIDIEVGRGTYTNTVGQKLSRDAVIYSTAGNGLVTWGAGTRNVFVGLPGNVIASLIAGGAPNGFPAQTADYTYVRRTLTAGFGVSIDDGDGVAGNPIINQTVIPAGTPMLFYKASAPTGWTQVTTHNNKALRIVSGTGAGSGGATAFTSVFGTGKATSSYTLQPNDIPVHTHPAGTLATSSNGAHTHTVGGGGGFQTTQAGTAYASTASGRNEAPTTDSAGAHTHTITGDTGNNATTGSGHTHGLSLDLQYVDVIICTKDA